SHDVRFVPKADKVHRSKPLLFNDLVGSHCNTESLCGLNIDDEFEFGWLLDRKISRSCPSQNAINVSRRLPEVSSEIHTVGGETASFRKKRNCIDRRNAMTSSLIDNEVAMNVGEGV